MTIEDFFSRSPDERDTHARRLPGSFRRARMRLRRQFITVYQHNKESHYAVASDHPLVRMLHDLRPDPKQPFFEYLNEIRSRVDMVARAHGISQPSRAGDVYTDGLLYGEAYDEIPVLIEQDIDYTKLAKRWRRLEAVKILRHPRTDYSLVDFSQDLSGRESGLVVLGIDLVVLAIQYYYWIRTYLKENHYSLPNAKQFVHTYPLTNALLSHCDWALFNRLDALLAGSAIKENHNPWPIYLRYYEEFFDDYLFDRLDLLTHSPMPFDRILSQTALVFSEDLSARSQLPNMPITRQVRWALAISLTPVIGFMLRCDYESGSGRNQQFHRFVERSFRELEQDRAFIQHLPAEVYAAYDEELDRRIRPYLMT